MSAAKSFPVVPANVRAAVFDLGGVLIEGGPGEVVAFGNRVGIDGDLWRGIRRELFGNEGSWAMLERGEIPYSDFIDELKQRLADAGVEVGDEQAHTFLGSPRPLGSTDGIRADMLDAVRQLKTTMPTALLTNNVREWRDGWRRSLDLDGLFDVVIDSSEVGARKPEPRIYEITQEHLGVDPSGILFVDDIGQNLKAAKALGWQTLLFENTDDTLRVLREVIAGR